MGKGILRIYKHTQHNWPYPHPNTKSVVPLRSTSSPKNDSTNDYSAALIAHNQPSPVSNLTTTNQVDTDVNNYGNTQYFATPRRYNHSTPEIRGTNTTITQVQPNVHPRICQRIHATVTTSSKLLSYGSSFLVFKLTGKLSGKHSVKNQGR